MVTPECRSYVGSCSDEDFETWSHKDGYESFISPEAISMRMLRQLDLSDCLDHDDLDAGLRNARQIGEDGELLRVEALASISINVAPCLRLVRTATIVCQKAIGSKARLLSFHVYVDDRLNCSCSDSERNKHRFSALVKYWRQSNNSAWLHLQDRLSLTRMEQRVYDFQLELPPLASVAKLDDSFGEFENRTDVTMPVAAVLIIGEDQETVRLFRELSLEQEPRMPTACSFHQIILPRWGKAEGRRHFLGSFRLEANLKARVSAPAAINLAAFSPLHFAPISPTSQASSNKKRKLSTQHSSAASQDDEPQE
jgi:hypothetical protein